MASRRYLTSLGGLMLLAAGTVSAHDIMHEHEPAHNHSSSAAMVENSSVTIPTNLTAWLPILLQIFAFGLIMPLAWVLRLVRSQWSAPTQMIGTVIAVLACALGHFRPGGRQSKPQFYSTFGWILVVLLTVQLVLSIYLKPQDHVSLTEDRKSSRRMRSWLGLGHSVGGVIILVLGWIQILLGVVTVVGFCQGEHLEQCVAHMTIGSAFVGYGIILNILSLVGQPILTRTALSPDLLDSIVFTSSGALTVLTAHAPGSNWAHHDVEHLCMGLVWWVAGLAGIYLSRAQDGRPQRNLLPAFILMITGWAMSSHDQDLLISTKVHTAFGYTLIFAGLCRTVEIVFIGRERMRFEYGEVSSLQCMVPFLFLAAGLLFIGATEEQMQMLVADGITHVSFVLLMYTFASSIFLVTNALTRLYTMHTKVRDYAPCQNFDDDEGERSCVLTIP